MSTSELSKLGIDRPQTATVGDRLLPAFIPLREKMVPITESHNFWVAIGGVLLPSLA
jgi:hypothetical protein